jgi:tetratricopeptide (TPR) repeat protein
VERARLRAHFLRGYVAWAALNSLGDYTLAEEEVRRALAIAEHLQDEREMARCWLQLGQVAGECGAIGEAEAHFHRCLPILEGSGDWVYCAVTLFDLGLAATVRGDWRAAEGYCRRSLTILEEIQHHAGDVRLALYNLAVALYAQGDLMGLEDCCRRPGAWAEGDDVPLLDSAVQELRGLVAVTRGDLAGAETAYRAAVAGKERFNLWGQAALTWGDLGAVASTRGDWRQAVHYCRHGRRLARCHGAAESAWVISVIEARALLAGPASPRAHRLASALIERGRAVRMLGSPTWIDASVQAALLLVKLELQRDQPSAARAAAVAALDQATARQRRFDISVAQRLLGEALLASGDPAGAATHLRAALAVQAEMGAALEAARTRRTLAVVLAGAAAPGGLPDEAIALLSEAQAQFATSGAALDLAQAEQLAATWAAR